MDIGKQALEAGLYIVATPLGNLRDISLRSLDVLAAADMVYCEDTRIAGRLFSAYGIKTRRRSYHEHNAPEMRPKIIAQLEEGASLALISDAGTPTISDPGLNLVQAVRAGGHKIHIVPGANAAIAALSGAGLATDRFFYLGFLPRQTQKRVNALRETDIHATLVLYESPHRLLALLQDIDRVFGDRQICIARELTKKFEEMIYGTAATLLAQFEDTPPKGEIVVLIAPLSKDQKAQIKNDNDILDDTTILELLTTMSLRDVVQTLTNQTGLPRKQVYARVLAVSKNKNDQ